MAHQAQASSGDWSLNLSSMKYGNNPVSTSASKVVMSSVDPFIVLPQSEYDMYVQALQTSGLSSNQTSCLMNYEYCDASCTCSNLKSLVPSISFELDTTTYVVDPSAFLVSGESDDNYNECLLLVTNYTSSYRNSTNILLGLPFMWSY